MLSRRVLHLDLSVAGLLIGLAVLLALALLLALHTLVLLLVIAAMLATAVLPLVDWLADHHLHRGLAVLVVLLLLVLVLALIGLLVVPVAVRQAHTWTDKLPSLRHQVAQFVGAHISHDAGQRVESFSPAQLQRVFATNSTLGAGRLLAGGLAAIVTVVMVAAYLAYDAPRLRRFADFATPAAWHEHVEQLLDGLRRVVGGYIRGQIVTSALAVLVGFVLFTALRLPGSVALAVFGGLADLVPIIGIYLWVVPSALAALTVSPTAAVIVVVVLIVYQEIESRLIIQRVYGQTLHLPPSVVVIALLAGTELAGIVGALLALPAAAAIRLFVSYGASVRQERARARREQECLARAADEQLDQRPSVPLEL